jgi:hypothetical protein
MDFNHHCIIESDSRQTFSILLDDALSNGCTIVASNSFWDPTHHCVRYYALLLEPISRSEPFEEEIPTGRSEPFEEEVPFGFKISVGRQ